VFFVYWLLWDVGEALGVCGAQLKGLISPTLTPALQFSLAWGEHGGRLSFCVPHSQSHSHFAHCMDSLKSLVLLYLALKTIGV